MEFGIALEFSNSGLLQLFDRCENTIAVTLYPDPFCYLPLLLSTILHPYCIDPDGILLILDTTSDKNKSSLRLRNPLKAKVLLQINDKLSDMTYYDGIIFLTRDVQYIDFEGKVVPNINSLRKQELFQLAIDLNLVSPTSEQRQCKVKELKDLVKRKLSDQGSESKLIIKAVTLHQECGQLKLIHAFPHTLLICDITQKHVLVTSATVKPFSVSLCVTSVVPLTAERCGPVSLAAYRPEDDSCIILMADGRQKDDGLCKIRSSGESKLLLQSQQFVKLFMVSACMVTK